ncbi:MAG: carboxypeptidase regulatory-like domain-containing protein [Polyangia bacterium]
MVVFVVGAVLWLRRPSALPPAPVAVEKPRGGPSQVALVGVRTHEEPGAGRFEGHVVSGKTNVGVPRAELTFAFGTTVETVTTDTDGAFVFAPSAAGSHALVGIVAEGFSPYVPEQDGVRLEARAGLVVTGLYFELEEEAPLEITVSARNAPLADVMVSLRTPGTLAIATPREAKTDAAGRVVVAGRAGDVVEASAAGFAALAHVVTGTEARAGEITLSLVESSSAEGTVKGRVVDDRGAPVDGAQVVVLGRQGALSEAVTAADGVFELAITGTAHVQASRAPYAPAEVVAEPGADVTLTLRSGCAVRGTVMDRGTRAAIASFTVVMQRVTGAGPVPSSPAVYDAEGRFEVRGVLPGRYAVQVLAAGYAASASRVVEVVESCGMSSEETFSLGHGGTVFGRITDGATHHPLVGRVSMEGFVDTGSAPIKVNSSATSDSGGNFEIGGLPAGRRSLVAEVDGFHRRMAAGVDISDGARTGPIDLELDAVGQGEAARMQITGVGAVLRPGDGAAEIVDTVPGGGAEQAGLKPGDRIVAIDGNEVRGMSFDDAMQAIRGAENTTVALGIVQKSDGANVTLRVVRKVLR